MDFASFTGFAVWLLNVFVSKKDSTSTNFRPLSVIFLNLLVY